MTKFLKEKLYLVKSKINQELEKYFESILSKFCKILNTFKKSLKYFSKY